MIDIRHVINENIELLEELELKCSNVEQWRSLAKPIADCIIKMRDELNAQHGIYTVQINEMLFFSTCSNMCKNCNMLSSETAFHMWLFRTRMTTSMRCPFCLYPYQ